MMNLQDILRDILGSYRVQFLQLHRNCTTPEASALDFLFRDHLYESFDYCGFAAGIMDLVPEDGVIEYRDDFGLRYMVFRMREEEDIFAFCGPFVCRARGEDDFLNLIARHGLQPDAIDAIRWYFKRIPVILDYLSWRHMLTGLLARYLANPDLDIKRVDFDHPEKLKQKPTIALSSIPFSTVEARYAVENAMLDAIRRGDISEATYQQNLFMGFTLDRRIKDPLLDGKYMVIAVNTMLRKAIEQTAVHPLYLDAISGQFVAEIENAGSLDELNALLPKMIRHYCLLVQQHSLERYSAPVRGCLNYIDFHYMEPLSLESLADRLTINKNYLSSRFHREVDMTVTDYINQTRVRRSVTLLEKSDLSMQAVAERCGFTDANYFTRVFKKVNGVSPNEYRRSQK